MEKKQVQAVVTKPARKCQRHPWQLQVPRSAEFAIDKGETVPNGPRSVLEFFVMEYCVEHCTQEGIEVNANNHLILFSTLAELSKVVEYEVQIAMKSTEDLERFLREHECIRATFESLCIANLLSSQH